MKAELIYREASANDLEQLLSLGLAAYGKYKSVLGEDWLKMQTGLGNRETYFNLLKIAKCFVCENNKELVGMIFLVPSGNPAFVFQEDWSYIRLLGIAPGYDGRGIGKELTKKCIAFAKQSGEKIIALHTSEFQDPARFIYESFGFKKVKDLDPLYGRSYLLYTLSLRE